MLFLFFQQEIDVSYTITNQLQLRAAFWESHPDFDFQAREAGIRSKGQNAQCATVRCEFGAWVDYMCKGGQISPELAERAVL